jgi:hypothetical protein
MTDPHANPSDADQFEDPDEVPDEVWGPHLSLREQAQIMKIDGDQVWLDIGSKFESVLPLSEWTDKGETPVVGDVIYLFGR